MRLAIRRISILLRRPSQGLRRATERTGGRYGVTLSRPLDGGRVGFFVGFLTRDNAAEHPDLDPPEAAIVAFVEPARSRLHERLVVRPSGLLRRTAEAAVRLNVAFEFHPDRSAALIRHRSMRGMPPEILALNALDFFTAAFRVFWSVDFFPKLQRLRPVRSGRGR